MSNDLTTATPAAEVMESTTPQQHHPFGPSRLQQLRDCPGSYRMQLGLEDKTSPEAAEGTMLHDRIARGDFEGLNTEQSELCAACLRFLAQVVGEDKGAKVLYEQHIEVRNDKGEIITEGTADVVILFTDGRLAVIDWKFGRNPVKEVNRNLQLAAYCLGAMQMFGKTACHGHIYQPRIYAASDYLFTKPASILRNIELVIAAAQGPALILNTEGEACKYCLAKHICPAFRTKFAALATQPIYDLTNPQELARLYEASKKVEKFCKEIKAAMENYIVANGECAGYYLKLKPGNRECVNVMAFYNAVADYITPAEFTGMCRVSVGGAIDAVAEKMQAAAKAKGEKLTKVAAKGKAEELMAAFVQRGADSTTITQRG